MRKLALLWLLVATLALGAAPPPATRPAMPAAARPATSPATSPATDAAVRRLIAELDADDPEVRRKASLRLNSLAGEALPAVEAALKAESLSPESLLRLRTAANYLRPRAARLDAARRRAEWWPRSFLDGYAKAGKCNPAYDAHARRAIELFLRLPSPDARVAPPALRAEALAAFKAAVDAGCDDPLVRCLYHLTVGEKFTNNEGPVGGPFRQDVMMAQRRAYPASVKFVVIVRHLQATDDDAPGLLDAAVKLFPDLAREPSHPPGNVDLLADGFFQALWKLPRFEGDDADPHGVIPRLVAVYETAARGTAGPLVLRGRWRLDAAWDARGDRRLEFVPPPDLKRYNERLAEAEQALQEAYKLDANDPRAPSLLIRVKMSQGEPGGGREAVETWFKRAMAADPDYAEACHRKLLALWPVWYGSHEEMIRFGHECLATENWRGAVPYLLIHAHLKVSQDLGDTKDYFERPEVWADVKAVYEGAVLNFPGDVVRRSEYAKLAAQCGQWAIAHEQFQALGDHAVVGVFGSKASMDYLRKKAARLAQPQTAPAERR